MWKGHDSMDRKQSKLQGSGTQRGWCAAVQRVTKEVRHDLATGTAVCGRDIIGKLTTGAGCHAPPPGDLLTQESEPGSPALQAEFYWLSHRGHP